jgi:hypothetical protein
LHAPTGNDRRLFQLITNLYNDLVYCDYMELLRHKPSSRAWDLNDKLTAVRHALGSLRAISKRADQLVAALVATFNKANKLVMGDMTGQASHRSASRAVSRGTQHSTSRRPSTRASRRPSNVPTPVPEEPPQLPPLPFQVQDMAELEDRGGLRSAPITKSFSTIEEQLGHRGHFRNATIAVDSVYTTKPSNASTGPELAHPQPRMPLQAAAIGSRRKGSSSSIPRVFTGSFAELEDKVLSLNLHKYKTPEATEPASPTDSASPTNADSEGPVKIHDFADESQAPSICPSPSTLLQRREALVSKDVQWEDRVVNGELIRSRRPSEKGLQRAQTVSDRAEDFDTWLSQASPTLSSSSQAPAAAENTGVAAETSGAAAKRGLHREHAL